MDDQDVMRTYGNTNLPEGTPDRPLVTFAVFAYNQEKYIREAVEGAFAQTYSPLEIILSDDCSTDRTFEIMEEMARAYRGPHLVKVRRGEINLATALHVSAVSNIAKGSLFVVAAGDDISERQRCDIIVDNWNAAGRPTCCLHSAAVFFEDGFNSVRIVAPRTHTLNTVECIDLALQDTLPFLSPTCAYTANLFSEFEPLIGGSIIEDGVMALRSLAAGQIISIAEPLVRIRRSSETSGTGYSINNPQRWNRFVLSRTISYFTKLRDLQRIPIGTKVKERLQRRYLRNIARLSRFILPTTKLPSIPQRICFLLNYTLFFPTSSRLMIRCADAAKISGFSDTKAFRLAHSIFKGRRV